MAISARKKRRRTGVPRVALIIETSLAYGRGLLHGVARYVRESGPWSIYLEQRSLYDPAPPWLTDWKGDGVITRASSPDVAKLVVDIGVPTVDLNEEVIGLGLPLIYNDHREIGKMAASHLLDRGFKHFGFIGYRNIDWSDRRQEGFQTALGEHHMTCDVYQGPGTPVPGPLQPNWENEMDQVVRWVKRLPRPAGVMACNDFRGMQLVDACRAAKVAVPDQVAVIGVDNEQVACELCNPPLTSVIPDAEGIGYQAAHLLDSMMKGRTPTAREQYVAPKGIVVRQSTDTTAIDDPVVVQAMHFIRQHACAGIGVEDVLEELAVSRSNLQRRFRAVLGRSVHDQIQDHRLERVKQLLRTTDLSLAEIADRSGFKHSEYLSVLFKRRMGQTITAFRQSQGFETESVT